MRSKCRLEKADYHLQPTEESASVQVDVGNSRVIVFELFQDTKMIHAGGIYLKPESTEFHFIVNERDSEVRMVSGPGTLEQR